MPSKATLEASLARYSKSLGTKQSSTPRSSNLVELDQWFRSESLRQSVRDQGYSLDKDQLVKLMEWKLSVNLVFLSLSSVVGPFSLTLSLFLDVDDQIEREMATLFIRLHRFKLSHLRRFLNSSLIPILPPLPRFRRSLYHPMLDAQRSRTSYCLSNPQSL